MSEEDDDVPDSGPFCEHWSDPLDCWHQCKCGHSCTRHCRTDQMLGERACNDCKCEQFDDERQR